MLKGYTKTTNLSAVSMCDVKDGVGTPVLVMSASFGKDGKINFGETVQNPYMYNANFDEVMGDNAEFKKMVKNEYDELYGVKEADKAGD